MTRVRRDGASIVLSFAASERRVLAEAARDLAALLESAGDARASDPALQRLLPDGYRGDEEAAEEFAAYSRPDLTAGKIAVARDLAAGADAGEAVLDRDGATHWLRGLTDLRLALAERLGIRSDDDEVPQTPGGAVYWWLGETQEMLVATVDRWDAEGGA